MTSLTRECGALDRVVVGSGDVQQMYYEKTHNGTELVAALDPEQKINIRLNPLDNNVNATAPYLNSIPNT